MKLGVPARAPLFSGLGGCIADQLPDDLEVAEFRHGSWSWRIVAGDLHCEGDGGERPRDCVAGNDIEHAVIVALDNFRMTDHYAATRAAPGFRSSRTAMRDSIQRS